MDNIPSRLPEKRGNVAEKVTIAVSFIIFAMGMHYGQNNWWSFLSICIITLSIVAIAEILYRICLISEELRHLHSRYDNILDLFWRAFQLSPQFLITSILLLFGVIYICQTYEAPWAVVSEIGDSWPFFMVGGILFSNTLRLKYGALHQAISIGKLNGLDYGSAMAYSFYHGYLQIVLPNKGTEEKGIKEIMEDFEASQGIRFSCDRLIVLIPLSLYCPPNIQDKSGRVELIRSMPDIKVSRAGVHQRSYKCTAYKIDGEKYVCVEYATPLLTLHNILRHRHEHTNHYELQQKELALQFYLTLQSILDSDPACRDCCDLIFFDDSTRAGQEFDVANLLVEHLQSRTGFY